MEPERVYAFVVFGSGEALLTDAGADRTGSLRSKLAVTVQSPVMAFVV